MPHDRPQANPHNVNSLLSPRDATGSAAGSEAPPEQGNTYATSAAYHADDTAASATAYQPARVYHQSPGRRSEYSRYDAAHDYSSRHQYAYADTAATAGYPQNPEHAPYDGQTAYADYSDYRDGYARQEYDYSMTHAAHPHSRQVAYEYDYEHAQYPGSGHQYQHHDQRHPAVAASHDEYYSRHYAHANQHAYARDSTAAAAAGYGQHSASVAGTPRQSDASAYYDARHQQYDYRYGSGDRSGALRSPNAHQQHGRHRYTSHAPAQYDYEAPGARSGTRTAVPHHAIATVDTTYGATSHSDTYGHAASQIPEQGYNLDAHLNRQSKSHLFRHASGDAPAYAYDYATQGEAAYRSPSQGAHVQAAHRDADYHSSLAYPTEADARANRRSAHAERNEGSHRPEGIGITSLLAEAPAHATHEGSHYRHDRSRYSEYGRSGHYSREYNDTASGYPESHAVMSISQLVGNESGAYNGDGRYEHSNIPGNGFGHGYQLSDHEAEEGAHGPHGLRSPIHNAVNSTLRVDHGHSYSPAESMPRRSSARRGHLAAGLSEPIVVNSDDEEYEPSAHSSAARDKAHASGSDEDGRPLASRPSRNIRSKPAHTEVTPDNQQLRRRRAPAAASTGRAGRRRNGAAVKASTADSNAGDAPKGTDRRRPARRARGSKKVELSREYVFDEDDEDDIPLERSADGLGGGRYPRDSSGDHDVTVPGGTKHHILDARALPDEDYSVDNDVQAYIHHVKQRTERAVAKYKEQSKLKSKRMHDHVVQRYGPYLRGYFESVGEQQDHAEGALARHRRAPREDEYYTSGDPAYAERAYARSQRYGNNHTDGLNDEQLDSFNGHFHPHVPVGYFSLSRPASPDGLAYKYSRNGTPDTDDSEPLALLAGDDAGTAFGRVRVPSHEQNSFSLLWARLAVEQVPRAFRHMQANIQVRTANMQKITQLCRREVRRVYGPAPTRANQLNPMQPIYVSRPPKELLMRSRRSMREMLLFWKRYEKEEREQRRRAEKEAAERMRLEEEAREARRQARKLNFLISQTELYSHFIGDKIADASNQAGAAAASGEQPTRFKAIDFDKDDDAALAAHARSAAQNALAQQQAHTREFDTIQRQRRDEHAKRSGGDPQDGNVAEALDAMNFQEPETMAGVDIAQPRMLMCQLKEYQLKGLSWLANLYEQGINGILADEMGLGKTVQSISLLAYLAETNGMWGPFMVVAPASTLHNWQQELTRFVPEFKVLPYWGSQKDRKVLRKSLWNPNSLSRRDSDFHVLVTSYQLVVSDESYLNRVKWQYMILDEAQAIKSSSSARWKTLLSFHCRNRLLLTGTPIQNSMQELWALLHFIMPTLFDSHEEFSEWFSRDIESHAENRTHLNQHQLQRLHMILKPFMLRRNKRHVQHELGEKIEHLVPCDLTQRQKAMYRGLTSKISVPELMERVQSGASHGSKDEPDENLMNLVMQFRKVCSHPELFERAEVDSPYVLGSFPATGSLAREGDDLSCSYATRSLVAFNMPKLLYRDSLELPRVPTQRQGVLQKLSLWSQQSLAARDVPEDSGLLSLLRLCAPSASCTVDAFAGTLAERLDALSIETLRVAGYQQYMRMSREDASLEQAASSRHNVQSGSMLHALSNVFAAENLAVSRNLAELAHATLSGFAHSYMSTIPSAYKPAAVSPPVDLVVSDRSATWEYRQLMFDNPLAKRLTCGRESAEDWTKPFRSQGLTDIWMPSIDKLIRYSGKMAALDLLLIRLKQEGHRVLLYFQMTKMIDLFEEYLAYRKYTYLRLDGSSKISDRRDMVMDWQTRDDIFIFLLSTRAGGLGINLTAADTVIFFESDWNPTVDSQAMDRAHRLGQTKQVVVYRLITRGTVEERILQRAQQKNEIHRIVIAGGDTHSAGDGEGSEGTGMMAEGFSSNFEPSSKEIVSLLLGNTSDDEGTAHSEWLRVARLAQETSNRVYGRGGYPGPCSLAEADTVRDDVVFLPPPQAGASLHVSDAHAAPIFAAQAAIEEALLAQARERERLALEQQRQRHKPRGGGNGGARGGKRGGSTAVREKRKQRGTPASTPKKDGGSLATSRAPSPEPSSKRQRTDEPAAAAAVPTP
ncbi:putative DNA helicase ino80 [Coemansia thaxteri]|uniref:Chromatin-remodeling ATPase INO80 n=1 Tax=Coemansia thaxteri TaxID=2663907 RepID=A0A9W8BKI8_9FUNG|nr:putative DNA helicase ino80 [Coemansia thaxteri]